MVLSRMSFYILLDIYSVVHDLSLLILLSFLAQLGIIVFSMLYISNWVYPIEVMALCSN